MYSGSEGRPGLDAFPDGESTNKAAISKQMVSILDSTTGGMYPNTAEKGVRNISRGEWMVQPTDLLADSTLNGMPVGVTSLNGMGSMAFDLYPDDEEQQVQFLRRSLKLVGLAADSLKEEALDANALPSVAVQIGGTMSVYAHKELPFGRLAEVVPPLPSHVRNRHRKVAEGEPHNKITMITRPYDPQTVGQRFRSEIGAYLRNPQKYLKLSDVRYKYNRFVAAINADLDLGRLNGLIMVERMVKAGILQFAAAQPAAADVQAPNANAGAGERLLGVAQAMGLFGREEFPISNVQVGAAQKSFWQQFGRDVAAAQHWDGRMANYGVGYNAASRSNPGQKRDTGEIMTTSAAGRLLHLQLTLWSQNLSAMNTWLTADREWVVGRVIRPSKADGKAAIAK